MGTPATAHGPYTWAPYLPARLPSASAVTRVKDRFAWCEATNRTVLPGVYSLQSTIGTSRTATRVDARGRPDWIPALLVGNISCNTVKQYEISAHAEPRTKSRAGDRAGGSVPCFDPLPFLVLLSRPGRVSVVVFGLCFDGSDYF